MRQTTMLRLFSLILQVKFFFLSFCEAQSVLQSFSFSKWGTSLQGKMIYSSSSPIYVVRSRVHCGVQCSKVECMSYFYNAEQKLCQINDNNLDFSMNITNEDGWQLYFHPATSIQATCTPVTVSGFKAVDCKEWYDNGFTANGAYIIYPFNDSRAFQVQCDMMNGGFTVIHNREDGSENFYRSWADYAVGFGDPCKEYWIGNDIIHVLTIGTSTTLMVEIKSFAGQKGYAEYTDFYIQNSALEYQLNIGVYSGNIGDAFHQPNFDMQGQRFSTFDRENDNHQGVCTDMFRSAMWFNNCGYVNLNGVYCNGIADPTCNWRYNFKNSFEGLKSSKMMIRRD